MNSAAWGADREDGQLGRMGREGAVTTSVLVGPGAADTVAMAATEATAAPAEVGHAGRGAATSGRPSWRC
jgi:hypothetical protein